MIVELNRTQSDASGSTGQVVITRSYGTARYDWKTSAPGFGRHHTIITFRQSCPPWLQRALRPLIKFVASAANPAKIDVQLPEEIGPRKPYVIDNVLFVFGQNERRAEYPWRATSNTGERWRVAFPSRFPAPALARSTGLLIKAFLNTIQEGK